MQEQSFEHVASAVARCEAAKVPTDLPLLVEGMKTVKALHDMDTCVATVMELETKEGEALRIGY